MPVWMTRYRRWFETVAVLVCVLIAAYALRHLMAEVHMRDIRAGFHALGWGHLLLALGFTALSYGMLTFYDVLALRVIGKPLPYRTAALAALTSYALSHNLGFALLTGGTARYRFYTAAGLEPPDVAKVIATAGAGFWSGVFVLSGAALLIHGTPLDIGSFAMSASVQHWIGGGMLAGCAVVLALLWRFHRPITIAGWTIPVPTGTQAGAQILVAMLDLAAASAALLVLVPGMGVEQFPALFLGYALAMVVALISHVPGGIGVFEAVVLAAAPPGTDKATLLAALVMYRVIYYLIPLAIAAVLLAINERRNIRLPRSATGDITRFVVHNAAPGVFAALTFFGGLVLLVSGALPAAPHRLHMLRAILPLPFVEASHIAASLAGTGLLLLAPALYRRLDAGWWLTRALLIAGALFSLAKGIDYEEAIILLGLAAILHLARPAFYRRTALSDAFGSRQSMIIIAVSVALTVWIGLFAYRHVDYQNDLWWHFAWKGDASRFLRASFAVAVMLFCALAYHLFRYAHRSSDSTVMELRDEDELLAMANRTDAMLALTGDKRFLHSDDGTAFVMYQRHGSSWIVMGDPVGPRSHWPDLLWRLRDMADTAQGRLLLYQITLAAVPIAIELGLTLVKYGEDARVPLKEFSLDGPGAKDLRYARRRAEKAGAIFEIVIARDVPAILPQLQAVSDAWLQSKKQSEKFFSVGRFDAEYLSRFDCAVVRQGGDIIAFANVLATANGEALSVDLMRHREDLPQGTMDYLFAELMLWGKAQGFEWFDLGIAPLSGIEARRVAPVWSQVTTLLYRHGAALYSFEGLRQFKAKFAPVWEPRYIAASQGIDFARALVDLQALIRHGPKSLS